jgi:hypothetical protein
MFVAMLCFSIAMQRYGFFLNLQTFPEFFLEKMSFFLFFAFFREFRSRLGGVFK